MGSAADLADFYQLDDSHVMTDERFWPRGFAALHPVILSADNARAGQGAIREGIWGGVSG